MRKIIESELTDEELTELERLSALGYTHSEIALYFNFDEVEFRSFADNEESLIHRHLQRGKLIVKANAQMQLLAAAESGNITAIQQLSKTLRERKYAELLEGIS